MMMKRVLKAVGYTFGFIALCIGMIFGLEMLKAFAGDWVSIPVMLLCLIGIGYSLYQGIE